LNAVGGGAMAAGELNLAPARREIRLRARPPSGRHPGARVGVLGAAALARGANGEYALGA
jgi:glucokinase